MPTVVNRLISVGGLRTVAIKHLVKLSVEHEFFFFFFFFFFLREKLVMMLLAAVVISILMVKFEESSLSAGGTRSY